MNSKSKPVVEPKPIVVPAKWGLPYAEEPTQPEQSYIIAIAVVTILAWQTDIGTLALMPFTMLATWYHEMGHGLAAIFLGAHFEQLVINADGSGYAQFSGADNLWGLERALVAAAGFFGSTAAGCALIIASRRKLATQLALAGLGAALLITTLIWVRSLTGWIILPAFGIAAIWIAFSRRRKLQRFAVEFLGVQGAISVWQDLDYMFSDSAAHAGSDTGKIADVLLLPHWFWGGAISIGVIALVWWSLNYSSKIDA
ncbi:M50 family metallopeptidase [Qipengyuania sp. DGS5-3]|uniref:M50 family metallopeptidase n=1 Tax=Qipengyuania sp. DGS5-3 TaxID=3349632 RepID=UPI0036D43F39